MNDTTFDPLRARLHDAAAAFADGPDALTEILHGPVDDVDRAIREPLEIFPVCHHSPASATAMIGRLRSKQPKVIYLELCEDMAPVLTELRNCRLPVAVQAFATELDGFPPDWSPLSVVAPITEASAEYQVIAYALDTPGVELVLVDRSSDHVYQSEHPDDDGAIGIDIGDLRPRFAELEEHLLHHGKVRHWSEWWHQYVEQPLGTADHDSYRQVMFLIGSLFRRLTPQDQHRLRVDEDRERHMWTRIREHLASTGTNPDECLYVCGAFHAASRVPEFGLAGTDTYQIPPRTNTVWRHGLIPSSHSAIETQFGLAGGSVSIAAGVWHTNLTRTRLTPFQLAGQRGTTKPKRTLKQPTPTTQPTTDKLTGFMTRPPTLDGLDEAELLSWSVEIVRAARRNGYLASTADAIAVFETSILLAGMRNRARPTPYDFSDAAVTCIEKDAVPGRRDVRRLVEIMLGGDRIGQVGYHALPPLARDVYDRLAALELPLDKRGVQRALLDISNNPELQRCSDVLWILTRLLSKAVVRPIMGDRKLGERAIQESWDVALGTHQRELIELGYEGVSIEQVLEQRLHRSVNLPTATAATALAAVEDATLYLRSKRLADELGSRALEILATERSVDDAPEVLHRARRLLAYYRTSEPALPGWIESFIKTGYAHYCTLLPGAVLDEATGVRQIAAMLGFLFSMESLAISLGCDRTQLELAIAQCHPAEPAKVALLWAAQLHLGTLSRTDLRDRCTTLLANPLVLPEYPRYLSGLVHALEPVPSLTDFVVEAISTAFAQLPDQVLLPWLPTLIGTLRDNAADLAPLLIREAGRIFPPRLPDLDAWTPPWQAQQSRRPTHRSTSPTPTLLKSFPQTATALATLLGYEAQHPTLLTRHPHTAEALATLLSHDSPRYTNKSGSPPGRRAPRN